jgi:3-methyladenine DNA glycosylase AlkD
LSVTKFAKKSYGNGRKAGDPVYGGLHSLRAEMAAAADPAKAPGMQAYMKSTMPYYGLHSSQVDDICKRVFAEHTFPSCGEWRAGILELWRSARHREERYAAIRLISLKGHRQCWSPELMPVLEEMIVNGAWWDYVDALAQVVGELLRSHPKEIRPLMRAWSEDDNLWKRRVSIICQISFKRDTDVELLYANIEPNLPDRDFFIRKAIGWALRAYAWTDPSEVARYVRGHEAQLSGLSRREALKNIG